MKPTFRVVMALVQTGSRLASGDCGTKISVFALAPIAGRASDIAAAAVYLASPAASFLTGKMLEVDGGLIVPNLDLPIPDL